MRDAWNSKYVDFKWVSKTLHSMSFTLSHHNSPLLCIIYTSGTLSSGTELLLLVHVCRPPRQILLVRCFIQKQKNRVFVWMERWVLLKPKTATMIQIRLSLQPFCHPGLAWCGSLLVWFICMIISLWLCSLLYLLFFSPFISFVFHLVFLSSSGLLCITSHLFSFFGVIFASCY